MGEANIRRENDPMYGVIPKKGRAPSWVLYRGVLVLVPVRGNTLTFLPASNMLVLDEEGMAILDAHIDANPYLLPPSPVEDVPAVESTQQDVPEYTIELDHGFNMAQWPDGTIESDTNPQEE